MSGVRIENHTTANYLEIIGLERSNNQWPAIMLEESHDLYTAAGIEKLKGEWTDISKIDLTSDYWYFWFVKEGADNFYVLSLSKKEFRYLYQRYLSVSICAATRSSIPVAGRKKETVNH